MAKRLLWLLWLGCITYAFLAAPPNQPNTFPLIQNLVNGHWEGINPLIVALFYLLGIWPMIYSCLLFSDGNGQKIPAWPFALLSFGTGAFGLLPYLALREPQPEFKGQKNWLIKLLDWRWTGVILTLGTVGLVAYGFAGNWGDLIEQFQTSRFIHVMSLDFCLLCLLFPTLLGDDMARRGMANTKIFWLVALIPLFGPLAYLCLRPALPEQEQQQHPLTLSQDAVK